MLKRGVRVFQFDPLGRPDLLGEFTQRVTTHRGSSESFSREILGRLIAGDPSVVAYVATHGSRLIGHLIGEIGGRIFIIHQANVDPRYPRTIDIVLVKLENWCRERKVSTIRQEVPTDAHDPAIWESKYKRYGFKVSHYIAQRKVV